MLKSWNAVVTVTVLTLLLQEDKELICSLKKKNFNYEAFQGDPIIELSQQIICTQDVAESKGNIRHDLAVEIISNLEEII